MKIQASEMIFKSLTFSKCRRLLVTSGTSNNSATEATQASAVSIGLPYLCASRMISAQISQSSSSE
jgi:hypothetical protein